MPDLIVSGLVVVGLLIATALYFLMVRRRGTERHFQRADDRDRAMSQTRAVQRFQHLEKHDRDRSWLTHLSTAKNPSKHAQADRGDRENP